MLQRSLLRKSYQNSKSLQKLDFFIRKMSLDTTSSYSPRILIIGAAYGGLSVAMNLINLCDGKPRLASPIPVQPVGVPKKTPLITLLDERDGIFHTMGAPLAHASKYFVRQAWKKFDEIPELDKPNVRILRGIATGVDFEKKITTFKDISAGYAETSLEYDYLVVATGSQRAWPIVPKALDKSTYISDACEHISSIEDADSIVVVGGGAVGIEVAGEIKYLYPKKKVTLIHSRAGLLSSEPLPEDFKEKALSLLREADVEVVLGSRVISDQKIGDTTQNIFKVTLSTGEELSTGKVIYAISKHTPRTEFLPQAALDRDGYVKVLSTMALSSEVPNASSHFAVGDINTWPGIKRVGSALLMGQFAATNIISTIIAAEGGNPPPSFSELPVVPPMMALAIAKQAVAYQPPTGTISGEDLLESQFGKDLGLSVIWSHLGFRSTD